MQKSQLNYYTKNIPCSWVRWPSICKEVNCIQIEPQIQCNTNQNPSPANFFFLVEIKKMT